MVYADPGFLISLYGHDTDSPSATRAVHGRPVFVLTPPVEAEFINAVQLRAFRKHWTRREARVVYQNFLKDVDAGVFHRVPLNAEIWKVAFTLARRHSATLGTRTLDVLHVASVKVLKPDAFCTFDPRQRKLAEMENLRVAPA